MDFLQDISKQLTKSVKGGSLKSSLKKIKSSTKSIKGVKDLLHNKLVLNIVALLAFLNVLGYISYGKTDLVFYFIVLALLLRFFTKNMIIILGVPLLLINLMGLNSRREGLENKNITGEVKSNVEEKINSLSDEEKDKLKQEKEMVNIKDNKTKETSSNPVKRTAQGLALNEIKDTKTSKDQEQTNSTQESTDNAAQSTVTEQQGFEAGRKKARGYEIDYATTIEDAYDELNKILGSDGIKRLTDDTQKLMTQQMQLANSMKGMQPVVESITPMVKQLTSMMDQMKMNGGDIPKVK